MNNINNIEYYISELKKEGLLTEYSLKENLPVSSVTYDSRKVEEGALFICKGAHFNVKYLEGAIEKGAVCYVSENNYEGYNDISYIIVNDIRRAMSVLALSFYGNLSEKIKMIGITGTKGKSTTTYFTRYIFDDYLKDSGKNRIGYCSGIYNYDGVTEEESQLTTPENLVLFEHMNNAVNSDIEYMVMEVSSQGLKYNRVDGVVFEVACFSNIGEDHISPVEHPDFEDYFNSKLRIFNQCRKACINVDSDHFKEISESASVVPYITFSINDKSANVYGYNIKSENGRVEFDVDVKAVPDYEDVTEHVTLAAFGTINVTNALAAIAIAVLQGVPMKYCISGLSKALVPGRMQVFRSKNGKRIGLVDYAHNRLSYELLLSSITKEFPDKKIVLVFGSSGSKAYNRREELGSIAGKYCRHVVLTEDDGADEDVASICMEIATYLGPDCTYDIVVDRPEAVRKAIREADDDTIVIAAGKAMETFQKRGGFSVKIESDVEVMSREFELI